jgi:hypothetical protein
MPGIFYGIIQRVFLLPDIDSTICRRSIQTIGIIELGI